MEQKRLKRMRLLSGILLALYLLVLIWFLLFAESLGRSADQGQTVRYNLIPLTEISRFWEYRDQLGLSAFTVNLIGNVLAFAPLGLLMPLTFVSMRRMVPVVTAGFLLSLLAESIQLAARVGSFDVDDVLLNTCGTLLGYLFYIMCDRIRRHHNGKTI